MQAGQARVHGQVAAREEEPTTWGAQQSRSTSTSVGGLMGEEERKKLRIEHEYWKLVNLWNMHEDSANLDTQDDLHIRPAMYGFLQGVMEVSASRVSYLVDEEGV